MRDGGSNPPALASYYLRFHGKAAGGIVHEPELDVAGEHHTTAFLFNRKLEKAPVVVVIARLLFDFLFSDFMYIWYGGNAP